AGSYRPAAGNSSSRSSRVALGKGKGAMHPLYRAIPHSVPIRRKVCSQLEAWYDEATNELINEELGIAYPIIDGIPNMIPEAARTTRKKPPAEGSKQP
uniref:Protein preY, mitochondrial n=1 Tax=Buteo japonicus TaxID=224669 RepID=A0A8C0ARG3_9AVES